jgi:hypothetical protein
MSMSRLTLHVDDAFRREMSERFPAAAWSCLRADVALPRILSPRAWLESVGAGATADEWSKARDEGRVAAALAAQRGGPWAGLGAEAPVRRAVLTVLAAYAAGQDVSDVLADLNMWAMAGGGSDPCELLPPEAKAAAAPVVAAAGAAHGWSNTVAAAVVEAAKRSNGVLPAAWFLWLVEFDRAMWLAVDGYGRRQPSAEALGAAAHHAAEKIMGRPLEDAYMDDAAAALVDTAATAGA